MKFENVLAEVNGFGRFQIRTVLLLAIPRMSLPFHFLLNNFIAAVPAHHCNVNSLDDGGIFGNLSMAEKLAVSIPVLQDGSLNSCEMFAEPQYQLLLNSSADSPPTVPCQNGWTYDNSTFKSTLATEWDLVCDQRRMNRVIVTIFFIGVMVGAAVFGYLSDRVGRKKALLLSYMTTAIFGNASAFSSNFTMFAAMRFFTGIGVSGISIITYVINVEWVDIKHRPAVTVIVSKDWSFFTALLSLLAYFLNDWRQLTAVATSPLLVSIVCWWWLPESARWLISNGNFKSAHYYLSQCAKVNKRDGYMAVLKPEDLSNVILVKDKNRRYSYVDLVRTPKLRRVALLTGIVWFGVASTYYGISLNIVGFGVNIYLTMFIFGATEIPAKCFVLFTLDKLGRRMNEAGMLFLSGLCVFCSMFIPKDSGTFRTAVGALGKMFLEGAFTALYLYTAELYPTVMRQNGLGYCSFLARLGVSICPLILLLEEVWVHLSNIVFFLLAIFAGLLACFLPETKNTHLPETIEDVEQTGGPSVPSLDEKSSEQEFSSMRPNCPEDSDSQ